MRKSKSRPDKRASRRNPLKGLTAVPIAPFINSDLLAYSSIPPLSASNLRDQGKSLSIKNAPTKFGGLVSYTTRQSQGGKTLQLDISNQGRTPRKIVWTPREFGRICDGQENRKTYELVKDSVGFQGKQNQAEIMMEETD